MASGFDDLREGGMSALAYAVDERRPPLATYSAGEGFVQHWAGFRLDRSGCDATLNDHLARANANEVCDAKRTAARRLADQLTAAMSAAFGPQEGR